MVNGLLESLHSPMTFEDKTLSCRDCHQAFIFGAGEQEFYAQKGLVNEPKRCPNCRLLVKMQRDGKDTAHCAEVPCHECGAVTRVPFRPSGMKPVYCSPCLHKRRVSEAGESDD